MAFPYQIPFVIPADAGSAEVADGYIQNHGELALQRLATQYRDKPRLAALLNTLNEHTQDVEDVLTSVAISTTIDGASNAQLDVIGRIVGEDRQGRDDATYRQFIRSRIRLNRSSGTAEDVLAVIGLVLPTGLTMQIYEYPPAAFELHVWSAALNADTAEVLASLMRKARAAGVHGELHWTESDPADTFTLDAGPGLDVGALAGASL